MEGNVQRLHNTARIPAASQTPKPLDDRIGVLPRLQMLRDDLLAAPYELCTQKAELLTDYMQQVWPRLPLLDRFERLHYRFYSKTFAAELQKAADREGPAAQDAKTVALLKFNNWLTRLYSKRWPLTHRRQVLLMAEGMRHILDNVDLRIYDHELIVGNCSSRRIGAPIHPDYAGMLMLLDLENPASPWTTTPAQAKDLKERIFPFWFNRSVLGQGSARLGDLRLMRDMLEGRAYTLTQLAGTSHLTPNHGRVLRLGFAGIAEEIEERRQSLLNDIGSGQPDRDRQDQLALLDAMAISAQASRDYGRRWQRHLAALAADEPDTERRAELEELAEIFSVVPEHPAQTFHQALQSIALVHAMVHQESFQHGVSFGRLDQLLLPYYEADLAAGRLTPTRAVELLGCFLGKAAELLPLFPELASDYLSGMSSSSGITLGGVKADGSDATNELSSLFLLAFDQMRLRQPNIHVRVHPDTNRDFMELCARTVGRGGGGPAFFSDQAIVPALEREGVSPALAKEYSINGCNEWAIPNCSFPSPGAGAVNMTHCLELALRGGTLDGEVLGPATPPLQQMSTVDELMEAFRLHLRAVLERAADGNWIIERVHSLARPTPFLSMLIDGCLERARDVTSGGADINTTGLQGVGLADMVDSLIAVETLVFGGEIEPERFLAALDNDFAGESELAERLRWRLPKYGGDDPRCGELAAAVAQIYIDELSRLPHPRGGHYIAGLWSMTTHQGFGSCTGALPSGRHACQPLANGICPQIGNESQGPTAVMGAAARVPTPGNGMTLNLKLSPAMTEGSKGESAVVGLIQGYFAQGGGQVQFNVIDSEVLRKAKANPALYRDLVVRVSGFTAYFCDLTPAMQDELIARTMHSCC